MTIDTNLFATTATRGSLASNVVSPEVGFSAPSGETGILFELGDLAAAAFWLGATDEVGEGDYGLAFSAEAFHYDHRSLASPDEVNAEQFLPRITDAGLAGESINFARESILTQSNAAMLAQANLLPQGALRLLS